MITMTSNPFRNVALAILASATVLGFAAAPAEAAEVRTASIATSSLELSRAEGRKAVEGRVIVAAERLCAKESVDWKNLSESAGYKLCVANAVRDARTQMAEITARTQMAAVQ